MILEKQAFFSLVLYRHLFTEALLPRADTPIFLWMNRLIKYISDHLHRIPAFVFDFPTDSDSMYAEWYSGNSALGFAFFVNDFLVSLRYL